MTTPGTDRYVRPLVFGYICVSAPTDDQELHDLEADLAAYTEREGYALAQIFVERGDNPLSALAVLIDAVRRSEARAVVVSFLDHAARSARARAAIKKIVEHKTEATVVAVYPVPGPVAAS